MENYDDIPFDDETYIKAKTIVRERKQASPSYLQRTLKVGFSRAHRFVEMMEEEGLVGPSKAEGRDVFLEKF